MTAVPPRRPRPIGRLDADAALIALLVGAMEASGHVSADEAARAHNVIWSMPRFRHRSGDAIGRRIARIRRLIDAHGLAPVIAAAAGAIPARQRRAAFAIAADLVLVDGRMERPERLFLTRLAADLSLKASTARQILDVIRVKNSL